MPRRNSFEKSSEGDFQEYIVSKQTRRRMKIRRVLRAGLAGVLMFAALVVGYVAMEAMLQVSELPLLQGDNATTEAPTTTAEPLPTLPEPQGEPMRSFYVPIAMLNQRTQSYQLQAQARQLDTNTAVMTFKDSNGWLTYRSNLIQMDLLGAAARARHRTDWTLFDLKRRAEQRVIAVIHTFDDPLAATLMPGAAIVHRETGEPWLDAEDRAWLNPWSPAAQEYLLAVIREVAAFGPQNERVDDILLRGVTFPAGDLSEAVFPGVDDPDDLAARNAVLREFLEQAAQAAGDARLIVMVPRAGAENADALGGDLWNSAADYIAIDVRGTAANLNEDFWRTRPVFPVVESPEAGEGMRDYIVLVDDAQ